MPQPRRSVEKLKTTGAHLKNPAMYKDRKEPKSVPLGPPSRHLQGMQLVAWHAFVSEIPWLVESDRAILEVASQIRGRLMAGEDLASNYLTVLRQVLSTLGATPADRSKIVTEDAVGINDPIDGFFQ